MNVAVGESRRVFALGISSKPTSLGNDGTMKHFNSTPTSEFPGFGF